MGIRAIQARVPEEVHLAAVIAATKLKKPICDITAEALIEWLEKRGHYIPSETNQPAQATT